MIKTTLFALLAFSFISNSALSKENTVPGRHAISGEIKLVSSELAGNPGYCYGQNDFKDIEGNIKITIRNGTGDIIGLGKTETGISSTPGVLNVVCFFKFSVKNIPRSDFYSIEIARRKGVNFSFDELQEMGWNTVLQIN